MKLLGGARGAQQAGVASSPRTPVSPAADCPLVRPRAVDPLASLCFGGVALGMVRCFVRSCPSCGGRGFCNWKASTCECFHHFSGKTCEVYDCHDVLCSGHGRCDNTTALCKCAPHYSGKSCELYDCHDIHCSGHGRCDNTTELCKCYPHYSGSSCEFYDCHDMHCSNHGKCNNITALCECEQNYQGCDCSARCGTVSFQEGDSVAGSKFVFPMDPQSGVPYDYEAQGSHGPSTSYADCACQRFSSGSKWPAKGKVDPTGNPFLSEGNVVSTTISPCDKSSVCVPGQRTSCHEIGSLVCNWKGSDPEWTPWCAQPTRKACPRALAETSAIRDSLRYNKEADS